LNNLFTRTLTGFLYVLVITGSLLLGPYSFGLVFLAITILSLNEFYSLTRKFGCSPPRFTGVAGGFVLFLSVFVSYIFDLPVTISVAVIPFAALMFVLVLYRKKSQPVVDIAAGILGLVYVAVPLSIFNYFAFFGNTYTYEIILGFFILIWINDSLAYLVGISFGKHRLFERISPKKSWEGAVGGALFTLIAACFIGGLFPILRTTDWIVTAIVISVAGVYGDLVESMMKRSANSKDSGKMLPGHGGILDRIDSVLLSAPFVFMYLVIVYN